ncbi:MAG: DegT/DnrJ/EryC1/StrS family aminotransferase [Opitutales bacterium]|nr:DegT/DnrJ/EryC1/StrS family aminotransferase [Opitutales bacterium]
MAVPLLDIANHNRPYFLKMKETLSQWLESGQYIGGEHVTGFENEVSELLEVKDTIAVSSGTDALLLALMALGIKTGDEVICPSFTFFATGGVVHRLGAIPVFADMLPESFNIDPRDVEAKITSKTKAIIPVHIFGQMVDMEAISSITEKHKIPIIEDAAQAIGATQNGKRAGSIGDYGSFSLYPTKNFSAFGDAGFLTTQSEELAKHARILRIHGMDPIYYHSEVGGNFRFDPIQGALLRIKLPDIDSQNLKRDENAKFYQKKLGNHSEVSVGYSEGSDARITLPTTDEGNQHVWHQFTIRVHGEGEREQLMGWLRERQIGCGIYYPLGLHDQECFKSVTEGKPPLPVTEKACKEVLSIPIFPELTENQLSEVSDAILGYLDN